MTASATGVPTSVSRGGRITCLYICYWSLKDPLCQTQSLAYLRGLAELGYRFALITFEHPNYRLSPEEASVERAALAGQGIDWHPLPYHRRHPLLATAYDCARGLAAGVLIHFRHRPRLVHSRSSIASAMAVALKWVCGMKFLYDADSRLSEEYVDIGHWSRLSLAYRVTAGFEGLARKSADAIVVLTETLRSDLIRGCAPAGGISVIPCCVDTNAFVFSEHERSEKRAQLGLGDERLFVYVGKVGSWYLVDEMFAFFRVARDRVGPARLLILSGDPPPEFNRLAGRHGLGPGDYQVTRAGHGEVAGWLSAADAGLAFIRSVMSKRGSSPIKVGEYLSVGLPVVITPGIGDCSGTIEGEKVGVVVRGLTEESYRGAADRLRDLWSEGDGLRARCRAVAEGRLDLERVARLRYRQLYEDLVGDPPAARAPRGEVAAVGGSEWPVR